jgi:hypothetical protein
MRKKKEKVAAGAKERRAWVVAVVLRGFFLILSEFSSTLTSREGQPNF